MADDAFDELSGTNDPFAFTRVKLPREPAGKYQTVGSLIRAVGWLSLVVGVFGLIGALFLLLVANLADSLSGGGAAGGIASLFAILQVAVNLAVAVLLMTMAGRTLAAWGSRQAEAIAQAKTLGSYAIGGGAISLILGSNWVAVGLIGVGIALLVTAGDEGLPAHFDD